MPNLVGLDLCESPDEQHEFERRQRIHIGCVSDTDKVLSSAKTTQKLFVEWPSARNNVGACAAIRMVYPIC